MNRDFFSNLQGKWTLHRLLLDEMNYHGMHGRAEFAATGDNILKYREEGVNQYRQKFYREFEYCLEENSIDVYFVEEGKRAGLFHTFKLYQDIETLTGRAQYACNKDNYFIKYTFLQEKPSEFEIKYVAEGPNKHYLSTTCFHKI